MPEAAGIVLTCWLEVILPVVSVLSYPLPVSLLDPLFFLPLVLFAFILDVPASAREGEDRISACMTRGPKRSTGSKNDTPTKQRIR